MLRLDDTALLLDGLKPPPGMAVDVAVGTTFTLDLAALLAVPVAATFATEAAAEDGASLLETVRRYAERTILFCQAGAISIPPRYRAALSFVEQTVVEVRKPSGGIFHPKAWVVRFAGRGEVLHRVLVMSRNLTHDRSWDVIVRLDEERGAQRGMANAGIVSFLTDLAPRAARDVQPHQIELLSSLVDSVSRARLAVPAPFESGSFVHLPGGGGRRQPFRQSCQKALAISPFLTGKAAGRFLRTATDWAELVSRRSALNCAVKDLDDADRLRALKESVIEAAETIDDTFVANDAMPGEAEADEVRTNGTRLGTDSRNLHAKVYVQDHDGRSTSWLGSANLTDGAFSTNVELLVRLSGSAALVGLDQVLADEPTKGDLSVLLEDYEPPDGVQSGEDDELSELDCHVFDLASADVTVTLVPSGEHWDGHLSIAPWAPPEGMVVLARLLSLDIDTPAEVVDGSTVWHAITQARITPFVVLEARLHGQVHRTLVRARLVGDPQDRRRSVIANAISSREDFMRYLAALLSADLSSGLGAGGGGGAFGRWSETGGDRILEDLLATASRDPTRLKYLDETLRQLQARPEAAELVPEEFVAVWNAVHAARREAMG